MRVKELIEALKEVNPEAIVIIESFHFYRNLENISQLGFKENEQCGLHFDNKADV